MKKWEKLSLFSISGENTLSFLSAKPLSCPLPTVVCVLGILLVPRGLFLACYSSLVVLFSCLWFKRTGGFWGCRVKRNPGNFYTFSTENFPWRRGISRQLQFIVLYCTSGFKTSDLLDLVNIGQVIVRDENSTKVLNISWWWQMPKPFWKKKKLFCQSSIHKYLLLEWRCFVQNTLQKTDSEDGKCWPSFIQNKVGFFFFVQFFSFFFLRRKESSVNASA